MRELEREIARGLGEVEAGEAEEAPPREPVRPISSAPKHRSKEALAKTSANPAALAKTSADLSGPVETSATSGASADGAADGSVRPSPETLSSLAGEATGRPRVAKSVAAVTAVSAVVAAAVVGYLFIFGNRGETPEPGPAKPAPTETVAKTDSGPPAPASAPAEPEDPKAESLAAFNEGSALFVSGRYEEAIPHLRKALALDPDRVAAHRALGRAHEELGRTEEAIAAYGKYLAAAPKSKHTRAARKAVARLKRALKKKRTGTKAKGTGKGKGTAAEPDFEPSPDLE
jgi:hypothetical protein